MQTTITVNDTMHELGLAKPLPQRTNSPTDMISDKIPPRVSPKPLTSPNIKVFDGMTVDEVKTWIVGTIAQYEEKHAITLQELSDALDKHATAVARIQPKKFTPCWGMLALKNGGWNWKG